MAHVNKLVFVEYTQSLRQGVFFLPSFQLTHHRTKALSQRLNMTEQPPCLGRTIGPY